ncbi:MAG: heavy-metal-associated domain-containing protein [Acidimicrobiia bacterium]|nr:heavy-metal-associated domain-containing protein [Acidimicrobiia bacterium]
MKSIEVAVPAMYADHHVIEVRRILFEIPGVDTINASAAFKAVEITYDPEKTSESVLIRTLEEAGYIGEPRVPTESGEPAVGRDGTTHFRHMAAVGTAGNIVSFGQEIASPGGPTRPTPGMATGSAMEEGEPEDG